MLRLGRLWCTNRGFDLLASLEKCNELFTRYKITKQLAFLIVSSIPSLKNIAQISSLLFFWLNQFIFTVFHISTLKRHVYDKIGPCAQNT